jgi:transposase-like protein
MTIHRRVVEVEREGVANEGIVRKWCRLFEEGRTNALDKERSGVPYLVTDDMKGKVHAKVRGTGELKFLSYTNTF